MGTRGVCAVQEARCAHSLLVIHYSESCEIRQIDVYFFRYETDHSKDDQNDIEAESDLSGDRAGSHGPSFDTDPVCRYFPAGCGIDRRICENTLMTARVDHRY